MCQPEAVGCQLGVLIVAELGIFPGCCDIFQGFEDMLRLAYQGVVGVSDIDRKSVFRDGVGLEVVEALTAETKKGPESTQLEITCYLQGQFVGNADFWIHGDALQSGLTWVSRQHRNLGVASTMYAYAKMLGNDIKPSSNQLHPGKMMWDAWRKSGEAQHLVAETINPDILNKKFNHTQVIGDYTYKASVEIFMDEPLLNIKAYDGNKEIGHIMFEIFDWEDDTSSGYMESGGTEVDPKYRNKGVASTMYAYAKMLGNDIRPSFQRTTAGRGMWDAWRKSGEAQHLVAEKRRR